MAQCENVPIGSGSGRPFVTDDGEKIADRLYWAGGVNAACRYVGECVCGWNSDLQFMDVAEKMLREHIRDCEPNRAIYAEKERARSASANG